MVDKLGPDDAPASDHGVYGISVAAELSGIAVQTLRLYERHGLLSPTRSGGGRRAAICRCRMPPATRCLKP